MLRHVQEPEPFNQLLHRCRCDIERRWKARARRDGAAGLPAAMPAYLDALEAAGPGGEARAWARVARERALTRVREGFDVQEIVHELALLRQVLLEIAREEGAGGAVIEAIERAVDSPIEAAVHSYVDARDYQTRRSEAEHISFMSHELRNPLATATLASAQLTEMGMPTAEHERALELIRRSLARLRRLLESGLEAELLHVTSLEARPVYARLGTVMEEGLSGARVMAADLGIELDVQYDGAERVWLDPLLTASALRSLFDNAIRFSEGGRLVVRLWDAPGSLIIDVRDTAERLSAEELRMLFEHRGLGLPAARRAIEAQGGTLVAQPQTGGGCHFRITLPKARH
jgi:signal transduction histidine kinase